MPTIQGRDFVIATLAAPTVMKEPEKPVEAEAAEGEEAVEGAEASAADGEKPAVDGDKKEGDFVPAMISAHNAEELNEAMKGLQTQDISTIDKANFIQAGMQKKKTAKDIWTGEVQGIFTDIVKAL